MTNTKTPRDMIALLESGKYKPAQGVLYEESTNGYCCLGVISVESGIPFNRMEVAYPFVITESIDDIPHSETGVQMERFWDELVDAGWDSMCIIVDVPGSLGMGTYSVYLPKHLASLNDIDVDNPVPFGAVIDFLKTLNDDWTPTR